MEVSFIRTCLNISTVHFCTLQELIICMGNSHSDFLMLINYIYAKVIPDINTSLSANQCSLTHDQKKNLGVEINVICDYTFNSEKGL